MSTDGALQGHVNVLKEQSVDQTAGLAQWARKSQGTNDMSALWGILVGRLLEVHADRIVVGKEAILLLRAGQSGG